jgi:hypothetical protein
MYPILLVSLSAMISQRLTITGPLVAQPSTPARFVTARGATSPVAIAIAGKESQSR